MISQNDIRIGFKKLGRKKVLGLAYKDENRIEIDSSLKGKDFINVTIHELLHILHPYLLEEDIDNSANVITHFLDKYGVIKTEENSNKIV